MEILDVRGFGIRDRSKAELELRVRFNSWFEFEFNKAETSAVPLEIIIPIVTGTKLLTKPPTLLLYIQPCNNPNVLGSGNASGTTGNVMFVDSFTVCSGRSEREVEKREVQCRTSIRSCVRRRETLRLGVGVHVDVDDCEYGDKGADVVEVEVARGDFRATMAKTCVDRSFLKSLTMTSISFGNTLVNSPPFSLGGAIFTEESFFIILFNSIISTQIRQLNRVKGKYNLRR
jgi:hypothetical protein